MQDPVRSVCWSSLSCRRTGNSSGRGHRRTIGARKRSAAREPVVGNDAGADRDRAVTGPFRNCPSARRLRPARKSAGGHFHQHTDADRRRLCLRRARQASSGSPKDRSPLRFSQRSFHPFWFMSAQFRRRSRKRFRRSPICAIFFICSSDPSLEASSGWTATC